MQYDDHKRTEITAVIVQGHARKMGSAALHFRALDR